VDFVAFSPDNDAMVASSSHDKTIKIWDASTQLCQQVLVEHSGWVYSVSWSPDSRLLASASKDMQGGGGGEIIIWDVKPSFQVKRKLRGHSQGVISVAWSPGPDNKYLASGGYDSTIKVWDAKTFEEKFSFEGHSREINVLAWSRNGTRLASGSGDKTIKIWDVAKQTLLGTLEGHTGWVLSMRWSPDGRFLASGSGDRTVKIWDAMKTYCLECSFEGDKVTWQEPSSAQASRSDFVVVALGDQLVVHRFCPATQGGSASKPTCLRLASTRCPSSVISVCSRGTSVVAGCSDGQVGLNPKP
jgi:WD40 repeat protein